MNYLHKLDVTAGILLVVGGLNWLLVGLFSFNLVSAVFMNDILCRLIYVIVGIAGIYTLARLPALYHLGSHHLPPHTPPMAS